MTQGQFLSGFKQVWIQSFPSPRLVTSPRLKNLKNYLPIAGGRIIGFIPFSRVLVLCEMKSVSSRISTRIAVSISYDDNHYTTGTSWKVHIIRINIYLFIQFWIYQSISFWLFLSIYLQNTSITIYLSIYLSVSMSVHLMPVCLSV